ncbi:BetR domain protein, partial [Klebsiella pneumoniae]|nr:BetR domain protein [Klebsiella pneumoniae]
VKINDQWHIFKTDDIEGNDIYEESRQGVLRVSDESSARDKSKPRIALLDDDKEILTTTAELLKKGPYKIDTFTSSEDLI